MRFALLLSILAFILPAKAEWLYWTVDFTEAGAVESPWTDTSTTPQVWLVASTDPLTSEGGTVLTDLGGNTAVPLAGGQTIGGIDITDLQGYSSSAYTFFIEMGAIAGQADYRSTGYNYADLVSAGFVKSGWTAMDAFWNAGVSAWSPTHDVPEPTSGVLLAFGAALLALRRRRRLFTAGRFATRRVAISSVAFAPANTRDGNGNRSRSSRYSAHEPRVVGFAVGGIPPGEGKTNNSQFCVRRSRLRLNRC